MPSYSHVVARVPCTRCNAEITSRTDDLVAFQWGYCPSRQPWDALFYRLGDAIRWRLDDAGRIRPWTYFEGALQGGNLGDPSVGDLVVRALDLGGNDLVCKGCGASVALRILGGRLVGFESAPADCDIAVVDADGVVHPRPDWNDHPMPEILRARNRGLATGDGKAIEGVSAP